MRSKQYLGVMSADPTNLIMVDRAPLTTDYKEYYLGDEWLDETTNKIYKLVNLDNNVATWVDITAAGTGILTSLTIDPGNLTVTTGDINLTNGDLNVPQGDVIITDGNLTLTNGTIDFPATLDKGFLRNSATNQLTSLADGINGQVIIGSTAGLPAWANITSTLATVTITNTANGINLEAAGGTAANTYTEDVGNAAPDIAGDVIIAGGTNINTVGDTVKTITINLDDPINLTTVNATTFDTNVAASGVTLTGTTLSADGTDADISINITAKGTGKVIIDDLNLSGLTAGTLRSGATGDVTSLADGANGTLLIGKTGDVPIWTTLTNGNNITSTAGANSISIAVTGTTDKTLQVGNATGSLTSLGVGGTGTILTGVAANNPTWTTATYPSTAVKGDILAATDTNVIGVITAGIAGNVLTANGAGEIPTYQAPGAVVFASDAETIAGTESAKSVAPSNLKAKLGTQTAYRIPIGAGSTNAFEYTSASTVGGNQVLLSKGAANPDWSTTSYPIDANKGDLIVATSDHVIGTLVASANTGYVLTSNGTGNVPSYQSISALPLSINTQTGTTYTLVLTDAGKEIQFTNGSAVTLTIPTNAVVAFPIGTEILLVQYGAGAVSVTPAVGVTLYSTSSYRTLYEQYSAAILIKQATDTFLLAGDLKL